MFSTVLSVIFLAILTLEVVAVIKENPFRLSKVQLTLRVVGLTLLGVASTAAGCGNPFGIAFFIVALMFGLILAAKMHRDLQAASLHTTTARHPVDIYSHEASRFVGKDPKASKASKHSPGATKLTLIPLHDSDRPTPA